MASFEQKLQSLKEMFPNHNPKTIEGILREMNGDVDNATSILLDTPENAPPPPTSSGHHGVPHGGYNQPPAQNYGGYPGQPYGAAPPQPAPYGSMPNAYGLPPQQLYGQQPQHYASPTQNAYGIPAQGYAAQPVQQPHHQPKPHQNAQQLPKFDHIFSNDFLRWPEDAEVIRVDRNGNPISAPPTPAYSPAPGAVSYQNPPPAYGGAPAYPGIGIPQCDPNDDIVPPQRGPIPQIDIDSDLIPGVTKGKDSTSWWENFKKRFQKKDKYESLN